MFPSSLIHRLLLRLDPERAHALALGTLRRVERRPAFLQALATQFTVRDPRLEVRCLGQLFPNPIRLAAAVDYITQTVRRPNVAAGAKLRDADDLARLLAALRRSETLSRVPALVKVSPDLTPAELDRIVDVTLAGGAGGIVATNTSARLA